MVDFKKKVQDNITRVKGMRGGYPSGWVKVTVGTEDKLYLDDTITQLKNLGLKQHAN